MLVECTQEFWDDRYRQRDRIWSGRPNRHLVAEAEGLRVGKALDVGCGEGADALWLAARGWDVFGIDVSEAALSGHVSVPISSTHQSLPVHNDGVLPNGQNAAVP